jgi:hypothetical protein
MSLAVKPGGVGPANHAVAVGDAYATQAVNVTAWRIVYAFSHLKDVPLIEIGLSLDFCSAMAFVGLVQLNV